MVDSMDIYRVFSISIGTLKRNPEMLKNSL